MKNTSPTLKYLTAVIIYGTIGYFLHFTQAANEFVVLCRGLIGSAFIGIIMLLKRDLPDFSAIKANAGKLIISGIALGLNWVFLFAGYRYGIAITSLCNYMAPIIVVVISALLYKQKLTRKQLLCILAALLGVTLASGVFDEPGQGDVHCVIYGLLAAVGFVILVLCNKRLSNIKPLDRTLVQLFFSALTVLPFVLFKGAFQQPLDTTSWAILALLGIVHTGLAYILYFNSIDVLSADKVAILGYLEPVLSILIGALVFKEGLSVYAMIGAVLILVSALINELPTAKK